MSNFNPSNFDPSNFGPTGPSPQVGTNPNKIDWTSGTLPQGKPLSANSPWTKLLQKMFPNASLSDLEGYAGTFYNNMVQWFEQQIKQDQQEAKEASEKLKRALTGDD